MGRIASTSSSIPCRNFPIFPYFRLGSSGAQTGISLYILGNSSAPTSFFYVDKTGRGTISTRLVFLGQKKLIGALLGANEEFFVSLKYGKSFCIWRRSD